jgi:hypothetical protein
VSDRTLAHNVKGPPIAVCIFMLVVVSITALGSEAPALTVASGVVLALTVGLLWRWGEPPALLLAVGLQLSQVMMPLLYANLLGVPIQGGLRGVDVNSAIWFGLSAMLVLAVGMRCADLGGAARSPALLRRDAKVWSPKTAFLFCIGTMVLGAVFVFFGEVFQPLMQPFFAISRVRWIGVFVLTCACMTHRNAPPICR